MVTVTGVENDSPFFGKVIPGDAMISVNGHDIRDVLDYRYYTTVKNIECVFCRDGERFVCTAEKDEYDDPGLDFSTFLMDKKRSCRNKCVFCFIDQNPKGMRDSVYFKDDDERLSFLQGSYITL
ncbi:MAG: radical SAM protein, partial [Clostridia bacterium]|nr:radical SAM protein [Clostridia bacterium]